MRRFYSKNISNDLIQLDRDESRHLSKVLRLNLGDQVEVINGTSTLYIAEIIGIGKNECSLKVIEKRQHLADAYGIHLAVAPTKNINRWEWLIEKATEIGVDQITPMVCAQSERRTLKMERQERIMVAAAKQSYKIQFPLLGDLMTFEEVINEFEAEEKFIAHCYEDFQREPLIKLHKASKKAVILIGPEGDFTKSEVESAISKGYQSVKLSSSRLRTETAAIVACNTLHNVE